MFYKGNSQQIQRLMRMGAGCAYDVLSQVVFRIKPSVRAAYRDQEDKVGASLISLYNKLNGVETHTSAGWVGCHSPPESRSGRASYPSWQSHRGGSPRPHTGRASGPERG